MGRHLSEGCEPCTQLLSLVSRINEVSAEEPVVPEHLVDCAKAVFQQRQSARQSMAWTHRSLLPVHLVYTRTAQPVAGSRSSLDAVVQAIFHAGDYAIDLQIEPEIESSQMAVVGQVLNRTAAQDPVAEAPVLLMVHDKQVARSESNRFGEFCLVSGDTRDLKLYLYIETVDKWVEIPLADFVVGRE